MHPIVNDFKTNTQKTLVQLKEDLKTIRTGRANPAMIEGTEVEAYGGSTIMKLKEMASLTTDGPTTIVIVPFDPSTSNDIERALLKSPLGLNPQNQSTKILVIIPPLSTEQREKLIKVIGGKIEEKKVTIRNQRDEARKKIKNLEDAKEISEDEQARYEKEIETLTQKLNEEIQTIKSNKEAEIREV